MIESLTVMLSDEQNDKGVVFPSEEEVKYPKGKSFLACNTTRSQ